ncbi:MAG: MFS transporter [Acidobacteriota bacterium]
MTNGRTFSLVVLFLINLLNFYDRSMPGALTEPVRKEFGLTDAQVGLMGSAFIWVYAFIGIPLGRVADVWSRRKLLAWGVGIWSLMTAASGLASSFMTLLIPRMGVGVGEAVCAPTGASWIGDLFPPERRSRALALFMLGFPIGGALSFIFAGSIADAWGWRAAMVTAAAPALLLIPALLMLREPVRGASDAVAAPAGSMWVVLRIPTMWWIIFSGALLNFNMYAIATFLPAMLGRIHHVSNARAGLGTAITYLIGGSAGGVLAGWLGDKVVNKRTDGRMLAAAALALVAVPFSYLGIIQPEGAIVFSVAMLTVTFGVLNGYYGLVYAAIQDIVLPTQRASTMAIYFFGMYMAGASFGPVLTGKLSDTLARRAATAAGSVDVSEAFRATGLQQAMLVIPVLSAVLAVVLYAGSRSIIKDAAQRQRLAS